MSNLSFDPFDYVLLQTDPFYILLAIFNSNFLVGTIIRYKLQINRTIFWWKLHCGYILQRHFYLRIRMHSFRQNSSSFYTTAAIISIDSPYTHNTFANLQKNDFLCPLNSMLPILAPIAWNYSLTVPTTDHYSSLLFLLHHVDFIHQRFLGLFCLRVKRFYCFCWNGLFAGFCGECWNSFWLYACAKDVVLKLANHGLSLLNIFL